jgi:hypothetical protein
LGAKFCSECGAPAGAAALSSPRRFASPQQYTPKHLAERILLSKEALEGERKQVTVLFADLKGSMELLADRDPEEARKLLEPPRNSGIWNYSCCCPASGSISAPATVSRSNMRHAVRRQRMAALRRSDPKLRSTRQNESSA